MQSYYDKAGRCRAQLVLFAALSLPALACASPSPNAGVCDVALIVTMESLDAGLTEPGELRHGRSLERDDGSVMVSAEFLPADKDDDYDGDILTWFTDDPTGSEFVSVDANAREFSDWPAAAFAVDEDGAVASRGCVLTVRGELIDGCDETEGNC
ncbi:MAG: hypothetical protein P8J50_03010 [Acidimicrobiales bacterium]|nr:hypothetical protein [Acidimicrobiales bacterium]